MPVQVVDGDERQAARPRDGFRSLQADEQRADQARSVRDGDTLDAVERRPGALECLPQNRRNQLEVTPGCHLRNDSSVARMQLRLRRDDVGEHAAVVCDDCRGGLVARGFYRQDGLFAHAKRLVGTRLTHR